MASAKTIEFGGPGTADAETTVSLKQSGRRGNRVEILLLSNVFAEGPNQTRVQMAWRGSGLTVSYPAGAEIDLEVVRCFDIPITYIPRPAKNGGK